MAYADQQMSGNRVVAIIIVALIHIALGYALITGLAYNAVQQVVERVTTIDIEEPPPPEEEPPPPPENVPDTPPPPVAPPPPINIAPAPPPIRTQTTIQLRRCRHLRLRRPRRPRPAALRRVVRLAGPVGSRAITPVAPSAKVSRVMSGSRSLSEPMAAWHPAA